MQKKNEKKFTHGEHVTIYPDAPESVASATECTGLMPTPPQNDAEFTSYQDLHSMETVSYTHLDVYKRQHFCGTCGLIKTHADAFCDFRYGNAAFKFLFAALQVNLDHDSQSFPNSMTK